MSVSTLALASTVHLALLVLIRHLVGGPAFVLAPSMALSASPWLLRTPGWLAGAVVLHVAWLAASTRWLRPAAARGPAAAPAAPRRADGPTPRPASPPPSPRTAASREFQRLPVLAVLDETSDIRTFRLLRPDGFAFEPGQFLMVRLLIEGKPVVRCYSISSAPEATGYLEISVKGQGLVSRTLHATVRPGSTLSVRGPSGAFTYPPADERPLVLLAGGIGITPLMSMLRHAVAAEPGRSVTLLYSVRCAEEMAFGDELRSVAKRHPQARVAVTCTRGAPAGGLSGRIDGALLRRFVADPAHALYCVCGPLTMIAEMKAVLSSLAVPDAQVRSEAFEAAVAMATEAPAKRPATVEGRPATRGGVVVEFRRSGRSAPASAGLSVLEAAEEAGVEISSLCRAGACGTCRTRLVSGEVEGDSGVLDPSERSEGWILACVSRPVTDCALEA